MGRCLTMQNFTYMQNDEWRKSAVNHILQEAKKLVASQELTKIDWESPRCKPWDERPISQCSQACKDLVV